jgi:glycosyltransferase involved in cell wall biosynthesis
MNKKLSVIIPLHNVENYAPRATESIIRQAFDGLEIVLVDDGSSDNSLHAYASRMEGLDVIAIRQENTGPGGARNTGIRNANGEYVMFLDADDFLTPNAFNAILNALDEQDPDVLFGRYHLWTPEEGKVKTSALIPSFPPDPKQRTDLIISGLPESSWGPVRYICRRNFLLYHEIYFETGMLCEDVKWALLLLDAVENHGNISLTNEPFYVYNYRRQGSTMNTYTTKRLLDLNKTVYELLEKYKDRPAICRALVWESFFYINEYCTFKKADRKLIFETYKHVLPKYKLSNFLPSKIAALCRNPVLFYWLSVAIFTAKHIRRKAIKLFKKSLPESEETREKSNKEPAKTH